MDVRITPSPLCGTLPAIPSKSDAHRILILAALADRPTEVILPALSKDIEATLSCLSAMGAGIERLPGRISVSPIPACGRPAAVRLDCGESGSTLRFLLPLAGALFDRAEFTGGGRLPERPLSPLREEMIRNGCVFSQPGSWPLSVQGRLTSGDFSLDGNISSQFFTGLLIALPLLAGDSRIQIASPLESSSYVDMTLSALSRFGVRITRTERAFEIPGGQRYRSPGQIAAEGDWSNAAFWLTAGALTGAPDGVTVTGLDPDSLQGDREIAALLRRAGAAVSFGGGSVTVQPGASLRPMRIDAAPIPDLVPILSVLASVSGGLTCIYNAGRLRIKESDRLSAVRELIVPLGGQVQEQRDSLLIIGKPALSGGEADSWNDHRIAMSAAVAALVSEGPVLLHGAEAVEKSYPAFWDDYRRLGGKIDVL